MVIRSDLDQKRAKRQQHCLARTTAAATKLSTSATAAAISALRTRANVARRRARSPAKYAAREDDLSHRPRLWRGGLRRRPWSGARQSSARCRWGDRARRLSGRDRFGRLDLVLGRAIGARPGKIVSSAPRRLDRLALHQDAHRNRIGRARMGRCREEDRRFRWRDRASHSRAALSHNRIENAGWDGCHNGGGVPPDRQRHGQGDRPGVPLARDAGERHACEHRGDRRGRENKRALCGTSAASDAAGAGYCRGDPEWEAARGDAIGGVDAAVFRWSGGSSEKGYRVALQRCQEEMFAITSGSPSDSPERREESQS
jgi:hypothetical protein